MDSRLLTALEDRYTIDREIGAGGMATVYLARDRKHSRNVALKVLNPELGAVLGVERFLSEIQVTANLQHPHLLPLFDSGEAGGLLFYVMPYVAGESLRARLERERQLPVDDAVRIATAVASALDYAHRHGVVHRDLKPENILLHDGQPLVADFGIALAVSNAGGARITQTGLSLGTPQYMSPEQAAGDRVVDGRSDIYSLAAVTYEMLAGEAPHLGNTVQAIIAKVLTERPVNVRIRRPSVPEHVASAIDRALEKTPADRFAAANGFADALAGHGSTLTHVPDARGEHTLRSRLRDPVVLTLAALLVAATAIAASQWSAAHREQDDETIRFAIDVPRYVSTGASIGSSVAITPDGKTVAFIGGTAGGSAQQLFVRSIGDVQATALPGTEAAQSMFLSPDGKWLGFWVKGRIMKVALSGGAPIALPQVLRFDGASWTSRGFIVVSAEGRLVKLPENGDAVIPVPTDTTGLPSGVQAPLVLPDGETVLCVTRVEPERRTLVAVKLSTGRTVRLGIAGMLPLGVVREHLVYATGNQVMAVAFDLAALRVTGTPFQVATTGSTIAGTAPHAALSSTGALVYYTGSRLGDLVLVDRHGVARPLLPDRRSYAFPRYSPDGRQIALAIDSDAKRDIWLFDHRAQTLARLTDDGTSDRPEWMPDGTRVLYTRRGARGAAIWWRAADLSAAPSQVFANANEDLWEVVPTHDGRALIMQRDAATLSTGADLVLRPIAGDAPAVDLVATPGEETQPRVSPDGKWLAFQSNVAGKSQVIVKRLSGSGGQVVVSTPSGSEPVWSRDGKHLYYRDGGQLVDVTYNGTTDFTVTSRTPLFADGFVLASAPHANYDVTPDGNAFLMVRPAENRQLVFAHNWVAELRRRISTTR